jgi:hypothetical protein
MKHKHYDLIVAWANGAKIQVYLPNTDTWDDCTYDPTWNVSRMYRIKPEPKPDAVIYAYIPSPSSDEPHTFKLFSDIGQSIVHNVKFTWDGETEKLKSAEVIK